MTAAELLAAVHEDREFEPEIECWSEPSVQEVHGDLQPGGVARSAAERRNDDWSIPPFALVAPLLREFNGGTHISTRLERKSACESSKESCGEGCTGDRRRFPREPGRTLCSRRGVMAHEPADGDARGEQNESYQDADHPSLEGCFLQGSRRRSRHGASLLPRTAHTNAVRGSPYDRLAVGTVDPAPIG